MPARLRHQLMYTLRGPMGGVIMRHYSLWRVLDVALVLINKNPGKEFSIE